MKITKTVLTVIMLLVFVLSYAQSDTITYCFENPQQELTNHPKLTVKNFNNVTGCQFWTSWTGGPLQSFGVHKVLDPEQGSLVIYFQDTFFRLSYFRYDLQPFSVPDGQALVELVIGVPFLKGEVSNIEFSWLELPKSGVYPIKEDCSVETEDIDPFSLITSIYPNPSSGMFRIETREETSIEIFDISGRNVYAGSAEFAPQSLPFGIYFCRGQGSRVMHKLLIVQ